MFSCHRIPGAFSTLEISFTDKSHRVSAAYELLERFTDAVEESRSAMGFQRGGLVDLRASDKEVIFIGDVHGEIEHLREILLHANVYQRLAEDKIHLVFLGDLFHYEDKKRADDMKSSVQILHLVQELKSQFPHSVHWSLGNHDLLNLTISKAGIDQNVAMGAYLEAQFEQDQELCFYRDKLSNALSKLPVCVIGNKFVAIHAGPLKDFVDPIEELINLEFKDSDYLELPPVVQSALCCRHKIRNTQSALEPIEYDLFDIEQFLFRCSTEDGVLISGHTPHNDRVNWHWQMGKQHILHASTAEFGYASMKEGELALHTVGRDIYVEKSKSADSKSEKPMLLYSKNAGEQYKLLDYYSQFDFLEFSYRNGLPTVNIINPPSQPFQVFPNVQLEFSDAVLPLCIEGARLPIPMYLNWVSNTTEFYMYRRSEPVIRKGYFLMDDVSARSASDVIIHIENDSEAWLKVGEKPSPETIMLSKGTFSHPDGTEQFVISKLAHQFTGNQDIFEIRTLEHSITISGKT